MPEDVLKTLGRRIQTTRKDCGFTQDELSAASGVSVRHIAKIEKGVMNPSFEILIQLVSVLGISLDSLVESVSPEDAVDPFVHADFLRFGAGNFHFL